MKKLLITNLFLMVLLYGEPYKPYPILFVHGYAANARTWGADAVVKGDSVNWLKGEGIGTFKVFLNKMLSYCYVWDSLDPTYTVPGDTGSEGFYPNKSFMEVISFRWGLGSIDEGYAEDWVSYIEGLGIWPLFTRFVKGEFMPPIGVYQEGWGNELRRRVKQVLEEYYGTDWRNNPDAKVILVAHSAGGLAIRLMFTLEPSLRDHVAWVVNTSTPHWGSPFMDVILGDLLVLGTTYWLPGAEFNLPLNSRLIFLVPMYASVVGGAVDLILSIMLGRYTDAGRDLGTSTSNFMRWINSDENIQKQLGVDYRLIRNQVGIFPGGWVSALSSFGFMVVPVQILAYSLSGNFAIAGLKAFSFGEYLLWLNISDYAVELESQEWFPTGWEEGFKIIERTGIIHSEVNLGIRPPDAAYNDIRTILQALENRPKIDTVYMSFPADGRIDTVILGLKQIDTIVANLDSVSIFFKLKDVYFLSQTKLSININGVNIGNLKYPENKGFNDRWCRIPSEYIRYLGAGLNELTITARNILGEQVSKTYKIWLVPAGWFVWNRFPLHREVFKPLNLNINTDSFSLYIIKEGLSPERLIIAWDSLFIIPVSLYQDTNNRWHFDTLEIKNYVNSDYYYHSPPGERYLIKPDGDTLPAYGKVFAVSFNDMRGYFDKDNDGRIDEGAYRFIYKINDSVKTITFLTGFYVDETPPVVELLEPEGVISGRKQKILFSFRAYDNLEQEIQTPDSMVFEIYRG